MTHQELERVNQEIYSIRQVLDTQRPLSYSLIILERRRLERLEQERARLLELINGGTDETT